MSSTVVPELAWIDGAFRRDMAIEVLPDGRFGEISAAGARGGLQLDRIAMIPGFVNAHSHAFQRGLRGKGEVFPAGAGSFWTWREAMYDLVGSLTPDAAYELSLTAFQEMVRTGITTVGEFHYIHHASDAPDYALDAPVIHAARDAGIRLVLLYAYYESGSIGRPLEGAQRRFGTGSFDEYVARFQQCSQLLDASTQTMGVVAHSIRAASPEVIARLAPFAESQGAPMHMHLEEQRQEIAACQDAYGTTPIGAVLAKIENTERFTAVHCTHSTPQDLQALMSGGGMVCICPLTEANLADGIADVPTMRRFPGQVSVGTDSNSRLCFFEELRMLEYAQRLSREERGVFRSHDGSCARELLDAGTVAGARSLAVDAGAIRSGALADFVLLDLDSPALLGWTDETLAESIVFGTGAESIDSVFVGGRCVEISRNRA